MKAIKNKQCCRYNWSVYPHLTIKKLLEKNEWLFNNSFNFFAYYDDDKIIPNGVFEIEKNWKTDNFVLFCGHINNLEDYFNQLDWDNFGTWYIYLFPSEIKSDYPIIIGRDTFLSRAQGETIANYYEMGKEWEFIHKVQPDIFITKQKEGIMIGSLNEYNLWCVDSELRVKQKTGLAKKKKSV